MEYRKLISFGKSSFVISLPKAWIRKNKIEKGDLVYLEESGPNLLLSSKENAGKENEEKETVINVDGKTKEWIAREVCSAYILNFRKITFKGKEIRGKVRELQGIIQNLMALEVMEQSTDYIVAKDFLNMDKVSPNELIRKMDVVTRTMIKEARAIFKEENYDNLNERDKDVNRLYFLLYRSVLYNLENPMKAMKNFGFHSKELMRLHLIAFYIEAIADEARRTARFARQMKLTKKKEKEFEQLFLEIEKYYLDTMKTVYNKDMNAALGLSDTKISLEEGLFKFEKDIQTVKHMNRAINRLQRMIVSIHNLGRVTYTLY